MVTGRTETLDKVLGLELGADDYVTKPFDVRELLARIKAILRRGSSDDSQSEEIDGPVNIGRLSLDFSGYVAVDENGKEVHLSHKEFDIVRYLWTHKNETVSRRELLVNIWGYEETPTTRTVDNFILKLRQKLEAPDSNRIIHTVHGIGYKMIQ
jgi:DNA-binding response OmpR family regulator